jgi:hydroxymethylpyrimidine kinase/phosphomethylpyrimidine kinase
MIETAKPIVVMSIAGLDPSAGAGILADIKTIAAFECYGVGAVTSVTFQNTAGVFGACHQTAESVRRQMNALFDDFEIAAIKTGMLPTRETVFEVAAIISDRSVPFVVVDPVIRSTSGFDLVGKEVAEAIRTELFPLASVVTPNIAEAGFLSGAAIRDITDAQRAAQTIMIAGPRAVLITGGDLGSNSAVDLLMDETGFCAYVVDRIESTNTHGTGCTLSSALACLLAKGEHLRDAIPMAKQYIAKAIVSGPSIGHGHGPLNHFPNLLND